MMRDLGELTKATRTIFLIGFSILLFIVTKLVTGRWLPTTEDGVWFQFALLLVVLGSFFLEVHLTKPNDVIINSIAVLVTLLALSDRKDFIGWRTMVIISSLLLILSLVSLILWNKEESEFSWRNKIAKVFYNTSTFAGQGRLFFSIIFILAIASYYPTKSDAFFKLLFFWGFITIIGPSGLANLVDRYVILFRKGKIQDVGTIIGILSPNIVFAKLNENMKINKYDPVVIRLSTSDQKKEIGFILGDYLLQDKKWIRIVTIDSIESFKSESEIIEKDSVFYKRGSVYKVNEDEIPDALKENYIWKNRKDIVGIIAQGSNIGEIFFEVIARSEIKIEEGILLRAKIEDKEVIYQITNGITGKETLEKESESGFVKGVAQQLGIWNDRSAGFDRYGWVPSLNTILYLVKSEEKVEFTLDKGELLLGYIPDSQYPLVYKLDDLISHHAAILGITGSGKTWLAYTLIMQMIEQKIKVVCIDFTGKYKEDLKPLNPDILVPKDTIEKANKALEGIEDLRSSQPAYKQKIAKIQGYLNDVVEKFMGKDNYLAIFELPDISNTFSILEFTQLFLQGIFNYARKQPENKQICLVLEEAHTVIPEEATLGIGGDFGRSKGIVGKISQIALQGRKYSVGFLVIAQRTANVTKTVLNQCNTIISFNAFDNTSLLYLRNYLGENMVNAIPNLKEFQAVTVGKAFKSKNPVIVQVEKRETILPTKTNETN